LIVTAVDRYGPLPGAVAAQFVQPHAAQAAQDIERMRGIQLVQPQGRSFRIQTGSSSLAALGEPSR
jgi:hypothetical protein